MSASWEIREGDCCVLMAAMPEASVDAIVCDPPYGLEFMGRDWDRLALSENESGPQSEMWHDNGGSSPYARRATPRFAGKVLGSKGALGRKMQEWHERWAREALRVLKPGGFLLAAGGTRTYHRLVCAVEDAGFEIRDRVLSLGNELGSELDWIYGSGFPKSLDVSKAIDKAAGAEREVVGYDEARARPNRVGTVMGDVPYDRSDNGATITAPATPEAERWEGWGTALKPAHEPIVVARKPLAGTVAANALAHGTGAINVNGCRIGLADDGGGRWPANVVLSHSEGCELIGERQVNSDGHFPAARGASGYGSAEPQSNGGGLKGQDGLEERHFAGEVVQAWECVPGCAVRMLDEQSGVLTSGANPTRRGSDKFRTAYGEFAGQRECDAVRGVDVGGASRFFYTAKASTAERGPDNKHPTVKPVDLMCWLVRLVTPPGGIVLDPFAGSGTTGIAALREGFSFIGLEREPEYVTLARRRIVDDAPLLNAAAEVAA